jgi:hypothetical protein
MGNTSLKDSLLDVFQTHNPLKASCLSVYKPIVNDLLQYWSYADTVDEVETYIKYLLEYHAHKPIPVCKQLVADAYSCRKQFQ